MRALLRKPAALSAAIGLALIGGALFLFSTFAAAPSVADTAPGCASTPPTPTPTPTDTTSSTTTPATSDTSSTSTTTTSTTPPAPQICVLAQPYPSSGDVLPGDPASYVVWVWSLNADSSNVAVTASITAASYLGSPGFSICPSVSGSTCTIGTVSAGDIVELLATVPTTSSAPVSTDIELSVSATGSPTSSDTSTATDAVVAPTTSASSSGTSSTSGTSGTLGTSVGAVPPLISLPPIPGTGVAAIDPSVLFPAVNPSPSPSSGSLGLPPAKAHHNVVHATETTAYAVPVDPRLLGAQIVGLVALAGAVTLAIVRLSLRKPQLATPPAAAQPTDDKPAES